MKMKQMKREWDGELESRNAELPVLWMLAWKGRFVETPCCPFLLFLFP